MNWNSGVLILQCSHIPVEMFLGTDRGILVNHAFIILTSKAMKS